MLGFFSRNILKLKIGKYLRKILKITVKIGCLRKSMKHWYINVVLWILIEVEVKYLKHKCHQETTLCKIRGTEVLLITIIITLIIIWAPLHSTIKWWIDPVPNKGFQGRRKVVLMQSIIDLNFLIIIQLIMVRMGSSKNH